METSSVNLPSPLLFIPQDLKPKNIFLSDGNQVLIGGLNTPPLHDNAFYDLCYPKFRKLFRGMSYYVVLNLKLNLKNLNLNLNLSLNLNLYLALTLNLNLNISLYLYLYLNLNLNLNLKASFEFLVLCHRRSTRSGMLQIAQNNHDPYPSWCVLFSCAISFYPPSVSVPFRLANRYYIIFCLVLRPARLTTSPPLSLLC